MNGIEFGSNNQTVLVWLFLAKTLHGIDFFSYNTILHFMQIPLIVWSMGTPHMSDVTCCDHLVHPQMSQGSHVCF